MTAIYNYRDQLSKTGYSALHNICQKICTQNPVTKKWQFSLCSEKVEIGFGAWSYNPTIQSHGGYSSKKHYVHLVKKAGEQLSARSDRPHLPYQFSVVNANVLNAWALPGGKIAIFEGLLKKLEMEKDEDFGIKKKFSLEDKVSAILAHEIVHAAAGHSVLRFQIAIFLQTLITIFKQTCRFLIQNTKNPFASFNNTDPFSTLLNILYLILNWLDQMLLKYLLNCFSRADELEADCYGMVYLHRAQKDPLVTLWILKFFEKYEGQTTTLPWLDNILSFRRSHPFAAERIQAAEKTLELIQKGLLR